ncbi:type II secretion system F family protein [Orrella daihaiensis]|uniref:Type II secretion system F family protein n=1 Tax=Orrella daihaiensis TaxID=2782176 RepID=A0ABY4AN05_9BURK|nr:type II secretion system F family protein [Orrella daihaiensis]UOD49429.1 type II secretion system F family protein [Orrella daihaiensis]
MPLYWLWLVSGAIAVAWVVWLIQRALYLALDRHRTLYTSEAEHRLRDLFLFVDLKLLWPAAFITGTLVCVIAVVTGLGIIAGLIAMLICWCLPNLGIGWARRQRIKAFEQQLPEALMSLAGSMRAGSSFSAALQGLVMHALPPLSQEMSVVNRQIRLGASAPDAFQQLAVRLAADSLDLLAITVRVAVQTGGPLAAMLEQTGHTMQANQQIKARLSALTAQGWLQAWVMGAMPLALMAALGAMDPSFAQALLHTTEGHIVLLVIGFFEVLGIWWLRRTVALSV